MNDKNIEIERKYLLKYLPNLVFDNKIEIKQYYLPNEDGFSVRLRKSVNKDGVKYFLTKKKPLSNAPHLPASKWLCPSQNPITISCTEIETEISRSQFTRMVVKSEKSISKMRYHYHYKGLVWEIDVFHGLKLIIAEIELPSEDFYFEIPKSIDSAMIMEVTGIHAFYNSSLAN